MYREREGLKTSLVYLVPLWVGLFVGAGHLQQQGWMGMVLGGVVGLLVALSMLGSKGRNDLILDVGLYLILAAGLSWLLADVLKLPSFLSVVTPLLALGVDWLLNNAKEKVAEKARRERSATERKERKAAWDNRKQ